MKITFVRHAQTVANISGVWQGSRSGGELTEVGVEQAARLGERLSNLRFDVVVASDLERAQRTAHALGIAYQTDESWRELDLGEWDGMLFEDILDHHLDELEAIEAGQDVPFGRSGETVRQFSQRIGHAAKDLQSRLGDEGRALVITHGGVIEQLTRSFWELPDSSAPLAPPLNTGLTRFEDSYGRFSLATYNDTAHLGRHNEWLVDQSAQGNAILTFVRHGQTDANVEGRVQGQTDWGLNETGIDQARQLAEWYGKQARVVSSPIGRAAQTARAIAATEPEIDPRLSEMGFGSWEGMTFEEVMTGESSDLAHRVFVGGEDLPRGGNGETWAALIERMRRAVEDVSALKSDVTLVSHGGSIRAFLLDLLGIQWPGGVRTAVPRNTAASHVALTAKGPVLADYGLAPHLER